MGFGVGKKVPTSKRGATAHAHGGGVGKTRLALKAAAMGEFFADGVAFIALAPLNAAELVVPSVVRSFG
jgi:predicted ATPase